MDGQIEENISVSVRVRPLNKRELKAGSKNAWVVQDQTNSLFLSPELFGKGASVPQTYDNVFDESMSTVDVYESVAADVVSSVMSGINGTIFAYGQTASGKTFTMQGNEDSPGILPLAARQIFEGIANMQHFQFLLHVSYIEVYNEQVKDLLSDSTTPLRIREDREKGFYVENVERVSIISVEELLEARNMGEIRRHVGVTNMNEKSSRSHTIFTIKVEMRENPETADDEEENNPDTANRRESDDYAFGVRVGQLNLVDLAGSENARNTGAAGERLKEGANINKSLLTLSRVISQLAGTRGKNNFINFRDSKLTQILQPSLGGNCRTAVVCCVTPASQFLEETKSTLNFASRAKQIRTVAVVNEILDEEAEMKKLKRTIESLKSELASQKAAKVEKGQLEARLSKLTALFIRGGASTNPFDHDELEIGLGSGNLEKKRKKKKKHRETWCPGGLLPAPAELGLANFDEPSSLGRSQSSTNVQPSDANDDEADVQSPVVVKKRRNCTSDEHQVGTTLFTENDEPSSSTHPEIEKLNTTIRELESKCSEYEEQLFNRDETIADQRQQLKEVTESLRATSENQEMMSNESDTRMVELRSNAIELDATNKFLEEELNVTRKLVETRDDELRELRKAIELKVNEHGQSVESIQSDLAAEREAFQTQVTDLKAKLQESFTAVANAKAESEKSREEMESQLQQLNAAKDALAAELNDCQSNLANAQVELDTYKEKATRLELEQAERNAVPITASVSGAGEDNHNDYETLKAENARLIEEVQQLGDALIQNELRLERSEQKTQDESTKAQEKAENEALASEEVEVLRDTLVKLRQQHVEETTAHATQVEQAQRETQAMKATSEAALEESNFRLKRIQDEYEQLTNALQDAKQQIECMNHGAIEATMSSMVSSVEHIAQLENRNIELEGHVENYLERMAHMQVNEATLLEKLERLENEQSGGVALGIQNNCLKKEVEELEQDKSELQDSLQSVRAELSEKSTRYSALENQVEQLGHRLASAENDNEALVQQVSELKHSIEFNSEAQTTQAIKAVMDTTLIGVLEQACAEYQANIETLESVISSSKHGQDENVEVVTMLECRVNELNSQLDQVRHDLEESKSNEETHLSEVESLKSQLAATNSEMEDEWTKLRDTVQVHQDDVQNLLGELAQVKCERMTLEVELEAQVTKTMNLEDQLKQVSETNALEANKRICQMQLEIEVLNEELETTRSLAEVAQKTSETQMSSLLGTETQFENFQKRIKQLEHANDLSKQELEKLVTEKQHVEKELNQLIRSAEDGQSESSQTIAKLQEEYDAVTSSLAKERSKVGELELSVEALEHELAARTEREATVAAETAAAETANAAVEQVSAIESQLESVVCERDELVQKLASREADVAELTNRVSRTQRQMETVNAELVAQEEAIRKLNVEHEEKLAEFATSQEESKSKIEELKQSLSEASVAVAEKEVQLAQLEEQLESLKSEKKEVEDRLNLIQDVQQVESELRKRVQQLTGELALQEEAYSTVESEFLRFKEEVSAKQSDTSTDEMKHQVEQLESHVEALGRQITSKDKRIAKLESCKMTAEIAQRLLKLKKDNKSYKLELAELRGENKMYIAKMKEERSIVKALKQKLMTISAGAASTSGGDEDNMKLIETLDREVNQHRRNWQALESHVESVAKKFGVLEVPEIKSFVTMLVGRLETLQQERDAFEAELADAVQLSQDLQDALKTNESLESKLASMSKELEAQRGVHQTDSSELRAKVAKLRCELESVQKELSDAQEIMRERDVHESQVVSEKEEECAALKQQLENTLEALQLAKVKEAEKEQSKAAQEKQLQDTIRFLEKENLDIHKKLRKLEETHALLQTKQSSGNNASGTPSKNLIKTIASRTKKIDSENIDPQTNELVSSASKAPRRQGTASHPALASSEESGPGECKQQ